MQYKILNISLFILFILLFGVGESNAQETVEEERKIEIPSSVKEELHRYMGYEDLLPKYVSLPYDVTMNTNVRGAYLDIGFLFLLFLPMLLVLGLKNKWLKLIVGILLILFLVLSSSNSYSSFHAINNNQVATDIQERLNANVEKAPLEYLLTYIKLNATQFNHSIYQALDKSIIQKYSGEGDYITYPILFLLFILSSFVLSKRMNNKPKGEQAIGYLALLYCFMWLILGAGVPWYGILMVALGLVLIAVGFLGENSKVAPFRYAKHLFIFTALGWFLMSFSYRMTNFEPGIEQGRAGAIHIAPLFYGLGKKNKDEVLDQLFPAYRDVLAQVNSDPNALVYRVGTFFQYFVDENAERVTHDNQLGMFNSLYDAVADKTALTQALKNAGYRYLLIDVNTAGIDNTPEKSLLKKVEKLNEFLVGNPMLEPIGTDRIIQKPDGQLTFGFSGGEVKSMGSFIAFKIK